MSVIKNLKKNVGTLDRIIRIILAALAFYCIDRVSGTAQLVLGIFGIAMVIAALNGFCLLYLPFNFSTAKRED